MSATKEQILGVLQRVKGPDLESNIVDLGLVSEVLIKDEKAYFSITIDPKRAEELEPLRQAAEQVVADIAGLKGATAVLTAEAVAGAGGSGGSSAAGGAPESARVTRARAAGGGNGAAAPRDANPSGPQAAAVPGVKHIVAVASGKGGVGKSTAAVNLALGFQANGLKTGLLDADIYGPSQPRLLGLTGHPETLDDKHLKPMEGYGLEVMSMGFMVKESEPVIWRGPMVVSALTQMLRGVAWGDLDILVVDMPPGTGDVQLTIAQQVPMSGAIIVSTPQDLALIDARKGLNMFRKVKVPVLGIIENMSYFLCPSCGERSDIFGHGGAMNEAEKIGVPFLGEIPLHMDIRATSDAGTPIVASEPDGAHARIFRDIASKTWEGIQSSAGAKPAPKLVMES